MRPLWKELEGKQGELGRVRSEGGDVRFWGALSAIVRSWDVILGVWDLSMGVQQSDGRFCVLHPQSPAQDPVSLSNK